jgi:putative endonuclease
MPGADPRQALGRIGEDAAAAMLERAGLSIVERRFRLRRSEIDLIATEGEFVVFVEVKTRSGDGYGAPAESVTPSKRRKIVRGALAFLARRGWLDRLCRFDVVEVEAAGGQVHTVRHIEDAFRPEPGDIDPGRRRGRTAI